MLIIKGIRPRSPLPTENFSRNLCSRRFHIKLAGNPTENRILGLGKEVEPGSVQRGLAEKIRANSFPDKMKEIGGAERWPSG